MFSDESDLSDLDDFVSGLFTAAPDPHAEPGSYTLTGKLCHAAHFCTPAAPPPVAVRQKRNIDLKGK